MRSQLVTACFLFLTRISAQHINIEVTYRDSRDDSVLASARSVASAIERDNRFAVARVTERSCDGEEHVQCASNGFRVTISSDSVSAGRSIEDCSKSEEQIQQLFMEFVGKFFRHHASQKDDTDWWAYRPKAPHAKHLEKLERLIDESTKQYTFALYYRPDGYNNFAAYYACSELLESDGAHGLVIDCSKEEAICTHQSVTATPTIVVYSKGKVYKQYPHAIDATLIQDWIKTIQQPVITKLSEDAVPYYREGAIPGFDSPRPSVIMFFAATRKSDTFKNYKRFAREHHGDFHLTELIDRDIEKWAHQPAFVAMKPLEKISKANALYDNITYGSMAEFIRENQHPSVHHLNAVGTLFTIFSMPRPTVIFFDITKTKDVTPFATLAANYDVRSKVAVFAVSQGMSMTGLFLADLLKVNITTPSYIFVDLKNECISIKRIANENEMEIEHWLKNESERSCTKASAIDMDVLASLRDWERRDNLRRLLENKHVPGPHEEL